MLVHDQIERLKREYTDKWVAVNPQTPELHRYRDRFGQVKTVNMNGRALVEFHGGLDTGWIDIDIDYLKVVEKPDFAAIEAEKKAAAKAAPKAKPAAKPAPKAADGQKLSPLEMARQMGAKKKDGGAKSSTADILAAARGKAAAKPAQESKPAAKPAAGGKPSTADILAAARGKKEASAEAKPAEKAESPAAKAAPADRAKMSTADILAASRGKAAAAKETPTKEEPAKTVEEPTAEETPTEETVIEEAVVEEPAAEAKPAAEKPAAGDLPKDVAGMLAYCRKADAN